MARKRAKEREEFLIRWRRKQVAEMYYENVPVKEQAAKLKVDDSTIYHDIEYVQSHADEMLRNFIVKTVPDIISKSLHQINLANGEAIKILKDSNSDKKIKLAAALAVSRTAKDVIDIVTDNDNFVDAALELDESVQRKAEKYLNGISEESSEREEATADPNRKF